MTIGLGSGRAVWKVVELLGARRGCGRRWHPSARHELAPCGRHRAGRTRRLSRARPRARRRRRGGSQAAADQGRRRCAAAGEDRDLGGAPVRGRRGDPEARATASASSRLPVEVVRFAWRDTRRRLAHVASRRRAARPRRRAATRPTRATTSSTARCTAAADLDALDRRARARSRRRRARPLHRHGRARAAGAARRQRRSLDAPPRR